MMTNDKLIIKYLSSNLITHNFPEGGGEYLHQFGKMLALDIKGGHIIE
jgi:hypothetical protein